MKKIILIIALLSVVFVSGCTGDSTGMVVAENPTQDNSVGVVYHDDSCRQDTDCLVVYCSETPEDLHCMCTSDMLQEFKCTGKGRVVSMKDPVICGCSDGVCKKV